LTASSAPAQSSSGWPGPTWHQGLCTFARTCLCTLRGTPTGAAWEFLRAHSSWDEQWLRFELHRFPGWPGQVLSYQLGQRVWLQARDEAEARAGDAFSLKDFHSKALSLGAMGLDPLREALSRC
jgi:hypothetical protein